MGLGLSSLISMVVITKSGSLRYDFILSKCSKKKPQSNLGESENGGSEKGSFSTNLATDHRFVTFERG